MEKKNKVLHDTRSRTQANKSLLFQELFQIMMNYFKKGKTKTKRRKRAKKSGNKEKKENKERRQREEGEETKKRKKDKNK